jgi:hypothetical protein
MYNVFAHIFVLITDCKTTTVEYGHVCKWVRDLKSEEKFTVWLKILSCDFSIIAESVKH